jgi:hypothetical protein
MKTRSNWKLEIFASLKTTINFNKSSTAIPPYISLRADLICALRELVFLPTSRLPCPIPEVLASTSMFLHLELSFSQNS